MAKSFAASIQAFGKKAMDRAEDIFKQSAQDVFAIAQTPKAQGGNMPVDTGILRNSLQTALNGSTYLAGADGYVAVIAGAELGDTIFGGWTVKYARRLEFGFVGTDAAGRTYNQPGNFFAGNAVAQWQSIVAANAAKVK